MEGFYGQFTVLMDAKGRISLPSKLRPSDKKSRQDHEFILTKGLDGCLALYPGSEWQQIQQRLGALNFTQKDFRSCGKKLTVPL